MTANLDDARRAYEAAKRIKDACGTMWPSADAKLLFTNASQDYAQALVDDAQRKLDAMGVVIGETKVTIMGANWVVILRLEADVTVGRVKAFNDRLNEWAWVDEIRPYVAPVVKEMVLGSNMGAGFAVDHPNPNWVLTLSNVTPADLDAMKPGDMMSGTYKIERMK